MVDNVITLLYWPCLRVNSNQTAEIETLESTDTTFHVLS